MTLEESRRLGVEAAYAIWTLRERSRGGRQTVSLSDMAREEKRVESFFEETGLIRRTVASLPRGRPERDRRDTVDDIHHVDNTHFTDGVPPWQPPSLSPEHIPLYPR